MVSKFIQNLVTLVNDAYGRGEKDMWKDPNAKRTNFEELKKFLVEDQLILAYPEGVEVPETNPVGEFDKIQVEQLQKPIGSVFCNSSFDKKKHIGEFGMLCASLEYTGQGLGTQLIEQAESKAKEAGCKTMRLELLTPQTWEHPVKTILDAWYRRLGYVKGGNEDFDSLYPHIVPLLDGKMNFTVYLKQLFK